MNKEFIPYEQAVALKELGFDEPCLGFWFADEEMLIIEKSTKSTSENIVQAPLYQQAFRWFREKYFKMCFVYYDVEYKFCFCIGYNDRKKGFKTYEEAELACINKLIEIVKTN